MRRFATTLALVSIGVLALGACGSSKDTGLPEGPTTPPQSKTCSTIDMTDDLKFVPGNCTAKVGDTVMWKNIGSALPHTVTEVDPKVFDSGAAKTIPPGGEFTFKFTKTGSYPYYCRLHATQDNRSSGMIGTVVVE